METQKFKREIMQAVNFSLVLIALLICNKIQSQGLKTSKKYSISVFKSVDEHCYLSLGAYHKEDKNKRFYSIYQINGLIFNKHGLNDLSLQIMEGNFRINAGAVGKNWETIDNLRVERGDSISISFYLEDDTSAFDPHPDIIIPKKNK
ncbi:hypothetical protein [Flagellimonas crocea]|uniref:hypothetical protein n=1 Tax=Flagellimonas crocea TaxID=3067311 RepID=UPI00296FE8CE|nr:hypothetical protein [Muricauda sp. DH64]